MRKTTTTPADLLAARYGRDPGFTPPEWNPTLAVQLGHRSVRRWLDQDVDAETIRTLAAAAQSASTSSNRQLVSVVAVRDPEKKWALGEVGGPAQFPHISTAPVILVWLIDTSRTRHAVQRHQREASEVDYAGLRYIDEAFIGAVDIGIAAQNAVVAAESLGLGAVFLGSMRNDAARVAEIVGAPEHVVPFLGLALGHPDPAEPAGTKPRIPQEAFLHWEAYDAEAAVDVAAYEQTLASYFSRYGKPSLWRRQQALRVSAKHVESGRRHLLRRVFEKAGFGLR